MRRMKIHQLRLVPSCLALACLLLGGIGVTAMAKRSAKPPSKKLLIKGCQSKKSPVTFDHPMHVAKLEPKGDLGGRWIRGPGGCGRLGLGWGRIDGGVLALGGTGDGNQKKEKGRGSSGHGGGLLPSVFPGG